MKINKTTILAALGSLFAVIAIFATVGVNNVSACGGNNDCFPPLVARCIVSDTHAKVGDIVTWTTEGEGGNGYYSFYWNGDDGLESDYQTVSIIYDTPGVKTGTIEITSNNETITRTCSVIIEDDYVPPQHNDLSGSCTGSPSRVDVDEKVTWTARASGGDGHYEYEWSGTDGLDGNDRIIDKRYDDEGTKTARVTITSDGESITKTCTVKVEEEEKNDKLKATCEPDEDEVYVGDRVKWTVKAKGGDGDYDYEWDGDNGLDGDGKTETITYKTPGTKDAEVEVKSDGKRVTARCDVKVKDKKVVVPPPPVPPTPVGGIYLSSIPATGISPTMKVSLFVAGLFMWSAFLAYLYIARRNEKMKEKAVLESIGE